MRVIWTCIIIICGLAFGLREKHKLDNDAQDDVRNKLTIEMNPLNIGGPMHILYIIKNASSEKVLAHSKCEVHGINGPAGPEDDGGLMIFDGVDDDTPIADGGEGKTGRCGIEEHVQFYGPITCVDVTIDVSYTLVSQPAVHENKRMRFITSQFIGPHWVQESPDTTRNYCNDVLHTPFQ